VQRVLLGVLLETESSPVQDSPPRQDGGNFESQLVNEVGSANTEVFVLNAALFILLESV